MKTQYRLATGLLLAAALAGCSMGKNPLNDSPAPTGNSLAMPPDLSLPAPSEGNDYVAPPPQSSVALGEPDTPDVGVDPETGVPPPAAPAATGDIYDRYGISKTHPNGKLKTQDELLAELKAARLAEKKRKNPNYGTIKNIGNIFKDG